MKSPTELSLELLTKTGWRATVVEHFVRQPRGEPMPPCPTCKRSHRSEEDLGYRKDLFGFVDILAVHRNRTLAVQTTSASNISARVRKIQGSVWFEFLKQAGWRIEVHGWGEKGVRVVDMTTMETLWDSVLKSGPRSRKTPRVQATIF
jgi:hypothetical protein